MKWQRIDIRQVTGYGSQITGLEVKMKFSCGTKFQQKVWRAIAKIPKGETRSYAWVAKMAGNPKAVRAAANACGKNPFAPRIPCHRVIRSDGSIGGFTGPLSLKRKRLREEGVKL